MKCPCKECISFAICYHQETIKCEILYMYVCKTHVSITDNRERFSEHISKSFNAVLALYKRDVVGTDFSDKSVRLANGVLL